MKKISIFISILLTITYLLLGYLIYDLGVLSNNIIFTFFIIGLVFIFILDLIIIISKSKVIKILLYILSIILSILFGIGIHYLNTTRSFIKSFNKPSEKYNYYYIVVNKDSTYLKYEDLDDKIIGVCENFTKDLYDKISIDYKLEEKTSEEDLVDSLYNNSLDAILISDVKEYFIEEKYVDFKDKVRVLKTIKIKKEEPIVDSGKDISKEPFVIFISGIDTSGKISKVSRSDVNIVVTVNPSTYEVLLTAIPRDYYVRLHNTTGYKDKLTHAGIYGIDMSINTIEDLLGVNIDYYARVNFDTVINLVDEIGGIEIYSDQNLRFCDIKKGYNYLDGKCALRFARERKSYSTGDRHRGENQEEVIKAIIKKVQSNPTLLTKYDKILGNLENNFETNVNMDVVKSFVKLQSKKMPTWNVNAYNLDGFGSSNYTYSMGKRLLYVMEPDLDTVNNANTYINGIIEGKKYSELKGE